MIKVYIADDHEMFRDGLKAMLELEDDIHVVGDSKDVGKIVDDILRLEPDVVLMDIDMGDVDGVQLTKEICAKVEGINILTISMHNNENYVRSMLNSGASGYILKSTGKNEMLNAIRSIHGGSTFVSQEVSNILISSLTKTEDQAIKLTPRETEILRLIVEEYSNSEIAEELFISAKTVDSHKRNLLEKLGLKNTASLVKYAIKHNLIDN